MEEIKNQLIDAVNSLPEGEFRNNLVSKVQEAELTQELIEEVGSTVSKALREQQEQLVEVDEKIEEILVNYKNQIKQQKKQENKKADEEQIEAVRKSLADS